MKTVNTTILVSILFLTFLGVISINHELIIEGIFMISMSLLLSLILYKTNKEIKKY